MHIKGVAPLHIIVSALPLHQILVGDEPEEQNENFLHNVLVLSTNHLLGPMLPVLEMEQ